jgi:lipid-binding SYLF domain-containing protein
MRTRFSSHLSTRLALSLLCATALADGVAQASSAQETNIKVGATLERFCDDILGDAPARTSTPSIKASIVGFFFNNKGLMYNLTLEGSKLSSAKQVQQNQANIISGIRRPAP